LAGAGRGRPGGGGPAAGVGLVRQPVPRATDPREQEIISIALALSIIRADAYDRRSGRFTECSSVGVQRKACGGSAIANSRIGNICLQFRCALGPISIFLIDSTFFLHRLWIASTLPSQILLLS